MVDKKFIAWILGVGARVAYSYRIVTDLCPKCRNEVTYGKKGVGKLPSLYCSQCREQMEHLYIQKERVVKH